MQIIKGPSFLDNGAELETVSATSINNVEEIEFRREDRQYDTLSITEFGLLAGLVFGTLMLLVLTQT